MEISRIKRSREAAADSYNKMSRWYDSISGRFESRYRNAGINNLSVKQGEVVLEAGFGTGHAIVSLARSVGVTGKVFGRDISSGMCAQAQKKVDAAGCGERVFLSCGDACELPYADGFFDAVFMSFTLELFDTPDIPLVLRECMRVLKPLGRITVVGMSKTGTVSTMLKIYEYLHGLFPAYVDCRPIYIEEALKQEGFIVKNTARMRMWGLPVEIITASK